MFLRHLGEHLSERRGVAMLTAVINWPLMAYRRKLSNKTGK
jgi:hypothetical protein